jgi:4a-hydroxytetrahydrobiopterin dehydratase
MSAALSPSQLRAASCSAKTVALDAAAISAQLAHLPHWHIVDGALERTYAFGNYYETMAFVNALAWQSHREDHHPDLAVTYNRCTVRYSTHSVKGISPNDFICAAKCDALLAEDTKPAA